MNIRELSRNQLEQLKQDYYCKKNINVSWSELANINALVSDQTIYAEYDGICFTEEDFF